MEDLNMPVGARLDTKLCPTLVTHELQPARLLCQWDSLGKNTGAGRRLLFQT